MIMAMIMMITLWCTVRCFWSSFFNQNMFRMQHPLTVVQWETKSNCAIKSLRFWGVAPSSLFILVNISLCYPTFKHFISHCTTDDGWCFVPKYVLITKWTWKTSYGSSKRHLTFCCYEALIKPPQRIVFMLDLNNIRIKSESFFIAVFQKCVFWFVFITIFFCYM